MTALLLLPLLQEIRKRWFRSMSGSMLTAIGLAPPPKGKAKKDQAPSEPEAVGA